MSAFYMSLFWGCTKAQTVRREKKHVSAVTVIWGSTRQSTPTGQKEQELASCSMLVM